MPQSMEVIFSLSQLNQIAKNIFAHNPEKVILFNGEMGVGKTTLIKEMCQILGVEKTTSSPTFSLVNEYPLADNKMVYHFDVYRLQSEEEALDMGIDDYLYSNNWCFIEWSEKISNLIPEKHSVVTLTLLNDGKRKIAIN